MMCRVSGPLLAGVLLFALFSSRLSAQTPNAPADDSMSDSAMDGMSMEPPGSGAHTHMVFTAPREGTAADSARALEVVHALRAAIQPYQDLASAEAAGYRVRTPQVRQRKRGLLHVGRALNLRAANAPFDPTKPQALLYRQDASGTFRLAGAMFTAPGTLTADELDARIPLSVARWHRHVNVCRGPDGQVTPTFRRASNATDCSALGGRFRAKSRYMVHVMTDVGDDLGQIFPQHPAMEG
jgi:hypothetical protein